MQRIRLSLLTVGITFSIGCLILYVQCGNSNNSNPVNHISASWSKLYGKWLDEAKAIRQTSDGGYIVAGVTQSFGTGGDVWVVKLNGDGTIAWQKAYGGKHYEEANDVLQTSDGGYVVAGSTSSFGGGMEDIWIIKLNNDGTIAWQKTYGGRYNDRAKSIKQTFDGGYIVAGTTESFGDRQGDMWIIKINNEGAITWQKSYGENGWYDYASSICQSSDGGYIITGATSLGFGGGDIWVLKLNSAGVIIWQKAYGDKNDESGKSIQQTSDGGYILAGYTSFSQNGLGYILVLKLNSDGEITWQKAYGGGKGDLSYSIRQTSDEGYIVAGVTQSFGNGKGDTWIIKIDNEGTITWQKAYGGKYDDDARDVQQTSDGGYIIAGYTCFSEEGYRNMWVLKSDNNGVIPAKGADTSCLPMATKKRSTETDVHPKNTIALASNTMVKASDTKASVK